MSGISSIAIGLRASAETRAPIRIMTLGSTFFQAALFERSERLKARKANSEELPLGNEVGFAQATRRLLDCEPNSKSLLNDENGAWLTNIVTPPKPWSPPDTA